MKKSKNASARKGQGANEKKSAKRKRVEGTKKEEKTVDLVPQQIVYMEEKPPSGRCFTKKIRTAADLMGSMSKVLVNFFIMVIIVVIFIVIYKELKSDSIIIEPFIISTEIENSGYSGEKIASKVYNHIRIIMAEAGSSEGKSTGGPYDLPPDIKIPGAGVSLRNLTSHIKSIIGIEPFRIGGVVTSEEDEIKVTINSNNRNRLSRKEVGENLPTLDEKLDEGARYILKSIHPYLLARYYYIKMEKEGDDCKKKDFKIKCWEISDHIVSNLKRKNEARTRAKAWSLQGLIVSKDKEKSSLKAAEELFRDAINEDSKYYYPYFYLGEILEEEGKYDEAKENYKKVVKFDKSGELAKRAKERLEELKKSPD